jgi:dUTP pyrophosphatase
MLHNLTVLPVTINPGDRIAQMILHKYEPIDFETVDAIEETSRGSGGFGSTGK